MKPSIAFLLLLVSFAAEAQSVSVPKNIRAGNTLNNLMDMNVLTTRGHLYGIAMDPGGVVGDAYLNEHWNRTTLLLYDAEKMIEGYAVRYEMNEDRFEIETDGGVKVLNGKKVKSFVWVDSVTNVAHYFINARDLRDTEATPLSGFFEVLTEGDRTLLSKAHVLVKEPTYNDKFDMGNRDTRILKKTEYYYAEGNVVSEVPSSKKKFLSTFGKHSDEIEQYVRNHRLSIGQRLHLRLIFEHYNGLVVSN